MLSPPKCKFMTLHLFPSARGRGFPLRRRLLYTSSDSVPYDDGTRNASPSLFPAISILDVSDMVELPSKVDQRPDCLPTGFPTNQLDQPGSTTAKAGFANSAVKSSNKAFLVLSVVTRGSGAVGICAWLIGRPVPFAIDHVLIPPGELTVARERSRASIAMGVELYSAVVL